MNRIQSLRIVFDMDELGRNCEIYGRPSKKSGVGLEWGEVGIRGNQLMWEMERFGEKLAMPMAGLPALRELDIRIDTHSNGPIIPILPAILGRLMTDLREAFEFGHFNGLTSLRLTAATNDLVPLLRSVSTSEICSSLRSFYCKRRPEELVQYPRYFPETPGKKTVYIDGQFKARESGSKQLLAGLVWRCPKLRDLTIPEWALFSRALRLHPENIGLERLAVLGTDIVPVPRAKPTEDINSMKRLTRRGVVNLELHGGKLPTSKAHLGKF